MYYQLELFPRTASDYDFLLPGIAVATGDNKRLLELQYDFCTKRTKRARDAFWVFAAKIALKTVNGELQRKKLHADRDERLEYAYDAVIYIMRRYEDDGIYAVKTEYISAIKWAVKHALYYQTDTQKLEKLAYRLLRKGYPAGKAFRTAKLIIRQERRGKGGNRATVVSMAGNLRDNADNHLRDGDSLFTDGG